MSSNQAGEFLRAESELVIENARKDKAEKNKGLGDPITLKSTPIDLKVRGDFAWTAESGHVIRKTDLRTGETVQLYKGHTGPVTSIAFYDSESGPGGTKLLITGSWDKTIKIWDTQTKALISSTPAHADFVKTLLVLPEQRLLISGGSDKAIRFWDLSLPLSSQPLPPAGSISSHTRPIEALEAYVEPSASASGPCTLFTSDTMGVIKAWDIRKEVDGKMSIWRAEVKADLLYHRTGVNQLIYGDGHIWSASTDETVQAHPYPLTPNVKPFRLATEKRAVKAVLALNLDRKLGVGSLPYLVTATSDMLRVYDVSSLAEPEFIREVEGHWHDVTRLQLWLRARDGGVGKEVWVVSSGLDQTLRRWSIADLIAPSPRGERKTEQSTPSAHKTGNLTEDEERELAELMGDD